MERVREKPKGSAFALKLHHPDVSDFTGPYLDPGKREKFDVLFDPKDVPVSGRTEPPKQV